MMNKFVPIRDQPGASNISDCKTCPSGFYCNAEGTTDPALNPCPPGYFCREGTMDPEFCPPGKYASEALCTIGCFGIP